MTSIDELFKKPGIPSQKRKIDTVQDPNEIYKQAKLNGSASIQHDAQARVEDDDDEDGVAGPELPPDLDEGEDEEGRFFGGGISNDTAEVLNFIEEREKESDHKVENIDAAWVRRIGLNFEKRISKNAELRAKFEAEPQKFMSSEADLDTDIKALSVLSEHPSLYSEFARLGCAASLVSLLAHENTDIAIDAIEVIGELIDQDGEANQEEWTSLADAMLEADLLDLVFQNISRLDEKADSDRSGVYHILEIFEALSMKASVADLVGKHDSILKWLLSRSTQQERPVSQNKQYAAEVLAVLLQSNDSNVPHFVNSNGVDASLQALSVFRKRDPSKGSEEEEFMENLFDCMVCAVDTPSGKEKFVEAEGIELCIIMLKEGKMSRPRALRVLDHALGGPSGTGCAEKLVDAAGLKQIFYLFMRKQESSSTEHLLGILASMLRTLPGDSTQRIRLLGKFVEKDHEKISRMIRLRRDYASRVAATDREVDKEKEQTPVADRLDLEWNWFSRRLDAGLYSLQTIDVILSWLIAEDDGAKANVVRQLADRDEDLGTLRSSIQDQIEGITSKDAEPVVDMLSTLLKFLV